MWVDGVARSTAASGRIALAATHLPAAHGDRRAGAWYEVVALDADHVGLIVADVGGDAERLRASVAACLQEGRSPAAALEALDRGAHRRPGSAQGTAVCVVLNGGAGLVRWSAAGPAAPLLVGPDGARHLLGGGTAALGGERASPFGQVEETVAPGSTVVLGVRAEGTEVEGGLVATAARCHDLAPGDLAASLLETAGGAGGGDALVLLLARLIPAPIEERLPADPRRLAVLRRRLGRWSAQAGLSEDTTADLQLLLSEAATNAMEHAYRDGEAGELVYAVRRRDDGAVRVEVQDFGRWRPPPADPGYRGRGLAVIHNLADEVVLDVTDTGTRIAFTVPDVAAVPGERPPAEAAAQWWARVGRGGPDR